MGALIVGSPGALPKIASLVPKDRPAISITFSALDEHVKMIRQLRRPSTIAVVSISEAVLQTARGVLAPVVGQRHTIREYLLPAQSFGGLLATDLVLCDLIARRRVRARKLVQYRLVSPQCLNQLSDPARVLWTSTEARQCAWRRPWENDDAGSGQVLIFLSNLRTVPRARLSC